jgi:hypothetical protein
MNYTQDDVLVIATEILHQNNPECTTEDAVWIALEVLNMTVTEYEFNQYVELLKKQD